MRLAGLGQKALQGIDHHVADHVQVLFRVPLTAQIHHARRFRNKQQIGDGVGHDAVDLFGMERSKLRKPASTWATGTPSLTAASVAAIVELTSPTTTTRSNRPLPGGPCSRNASNRSRIRAVLRLFPRAYFEVNVGRRHLQFPEEDGGQIIVVVLTGVTSVGRSANSRPGRKNSGATLVKFGRAPTRLRNSERS